MNTETAAQYAQRAIADLGLQAADSERMAIWCYNHPACKALPKLHGERTRQIWISRKVFDCLRTIAKSTNNGETSHTTDAFADAFLTLAVKEQVPQVWNMHERYEQEEAEMLAALRSKEPGLEKEVA